MNKGQIVKLTYTVKDYWNGNKKFEGYGICINPEKNLFVAEDMYMVNTERVSVSPVPDMARQYVSGRYPYGAGFREATVTINATRNVPGETRTALTDMGLEALCLLNETKKYLEVKDKFEASIQNRTSKIEKDSKSIRENRGLLTKDEFLKEFMHDLSDPVKNAYANGGCRGYSGTTGIWESNIYGNRIDFHRSCWIDKYIGNKYDFTYREYDGELSIRDETGQYKRIKEQYRRELPLKDAKLEDYLTVGDKESLEYQQYYRVEFDGNKPLTKAYAKELADKVCGISKTKKQEQKDDIDYDMEK